MRSQKAARERGVDLSHLKARKVTYGDFEDFDYILAMDEDNYSILMDACPKSYQDKIHYFLDYAKHLGVREVPDPYYGGINGFERVLDLIEEAVNGFLTDLQATGKLLANRTTY